MTRREIFRLQPGDEGAAAETFRVMAGAFEEEHHQLSQTYLERLLRREDFWAMAARVDGTIVGGITGHALPMTRSEEWELFIYDLAVKAEYRRQGIGRALVQELCAAAAERGIGLAFVPAEDEDTEAVEFYRAIQGEESGVRIFVFAPAAAEVED